MLQPLVVQILKPVALPKNGLPDAVDLRHDDAHVPGQAEIDLLTACARTNPDSATRERIGNLFSSDLDWSHLLELAEQHGVLSLLYWNLKPYALAEDIKRKLLQAFTDNARFNLFRTREMLNVLALFESQGIPALSFKGPLLAQFAYGNLALRQFGDLDILVQKRHLHRARNCLLSHGYRWGVPLNWWQTQFPLLSNRKDNVLVRKDHGIIVELHGQLSGNHFRFPLNLKNLLPRLQTAKIGGQQIRSLPPEVLISYLCLHGSRHSWERLLWISDVAQIIRAHVSMDWDSVVSEARKFGSQYTLALGLLLARDLLGARVPPQVLQNLQIEPATESLAKGLRESLFQTTSSAKGITYWHELHLRMRERPSDRLRLRIHYCRRYLRLALVPNERDKAMVALPRSLSFLYYLLRSFRLLKQFGVTGLNKAIGTKSGPTG